MLEFSKNLEDMHCVRLFSNQDRETTLTLKENSYKCQQKHADADVKTARCFYKINIKIQKSSEARNKIV